MAAQGADIGLLTYGTRGDVEPFLALAVALQRAGHRPRLAAPATYASLAAAHRVPFHPLPGDLPALAHEMVTRAGTNSLRTVLTISRFIEPLAVQAYRSMQAWSADADLIVHSFLTTRVGFDLAEESGIPSASAQFFPVFAPTAAFPAPVFPDLPLGDLYRRLTHEIVTQIYRRGGDLIYRRVRRADPSLPSPGPWPFQAGSHSRPPILFAFSRYVIPPTPEWAGVADVTGYWLPGIPPGWSPPLELERFLDGEAPVYIGLGSGSAAGRGAWIAAAAAALQLVGARGVLDLGAGDPAELRLPPSVLAVRDLPHTWLFPRMAAVVHHGGAGTTGAGLTAGKAHGRDPHVFRPALLGTARACARRRPGTDPSPKAERRYAGPRPLHHSGRSRRARPGRRAGRADARRGRRGRGRRSNHQPLGRLTRHRPHHLTGGSATCQVVRHGCGCSEAACAQTAWGLLSGSRTSAGGVSSSRRIGARGSPPQAKG